VVDTSISVTDLTAGRNEDELWGSGVMVLTKNDNKDHRLHFFQLDETSSFEGEENWMEAKTEDSVLGETTAIEIQASTKGKYMTEHNSVYSVSNLKVEGNVFHVHATMGDSAKMVSEFDSTLDTRPSPCSCCSCCSCCNCCDCCCSCNCCSCCCSCCSSKKMFVQGSWFGSASYEAIPEQFTDEIKEDIRDGAEVEFPEVTRIPSTNKRAWRTSAKHYVKIMYWDFLTDSISLCEVLLQKDEPFSKINKVCVVWLSDCARAASN
jgi:hypothetical protein